jgi:hypothetical protein
VAVSERAVNDIKERIRQEPSMWRAYCLGHDHARGEVDDRLAALERENAALRGERDEAVEHLRAVLCDPCRVVMRGAEREWCAVHERNAPCPRPDHRAARAWLAWRTPAALPGTTPDGV